MGKMLVRVYETYLSVTIGDFTFYLSHHVLSCHTTTISTLIQSNHSFLSDKSIPPYITHSPILPSTSRIKKQDPPFPFFFFFFWNQQNRPMIHLAFLSRDGIISPAKSCLNGLRSPGPPSTIRPLCVPCIASSWRTWREEDPRYSTYSRSSEMGDRRQ